MKAIDYFAAAYANAAMPARPPLETDDWATAESIPLTPNVARCSAVAGHHCQAVQAI
jgi:hypothetical protein